ncbi:MAG: 4-hydroxythreonine-4-phosphate dehydrogenase [Hyphomicrobiales bacterium]|nr:4-hydroxythreonine-4-phosphate dehydrogenase [Hyphomicrobiales bacterium]
MLTRNDATVENALDLVEAARPLGLKHIGFKDVGADAAMLRRLTAAIREAGASPWMEIVATSREAELRGVELGRDLGVAMLMGGVHVEQALKILDGSATRYLPFAGAPSGHPTRLGGSAPEVEAQCRAFARQGCAGVDILAYRATEAAPLDLVAACRRGFLDAGTVVVAGSINSPERVTAVRAAGADAFTIGAAAIDGSYAPGAGSLAAQLSAVLADCARAQ